MARSPRDPDVPASPGELFGAELRYWRMAAGMTISGLADLCGRDRRTISGAEEGRDIPSEALVDDLDRILDAGGLLLSRYEAVVDEKRRRRRNRDAARLSVSPNRDEADASTFVTETIPDGTLMAPGARFTKTWTIRNAGTVAWRGRFLTRVGVSSGTGLITTPAMVAIEETLPGALTTIAVECVAHQIAGTSLAAFKMTDADGGMFFPDRYGPGLQVQVTVITG